MSVRGYILCAAAVLDAVAWYVIIETVRGLAKLCPCIASIGG